MEEVMLDTTTLWPALFASLPATVAALAALISSIRNGKKSDLIHEQVNSKASLAQSQITELTNKVEAMTAEAAEKKEIASLLAQSVVEAAPAKPKSRK